MLIKCKICHEEMDRLLIIEHAIIKHDDKQAKELLNIINTLSRRGGGWGT